MTAALMSLRFGLPASISGLRISFIYLRSTTRDLPAGKLQTGKLLTGGMGSVLEYVMSAVYLHRGRRGVPLVLAAAIVAAAGLIGLAAQPATAAEVVDVQIDNARLMSVPERTATIVVGNPMIADVSLQGGGVLVVTGKSYGTTNFLALDRAGNVLADRRLVVRGGAGHVVSVYYGVERATLSCNPQCQPRVALGDGAKMFDTTVSQINARNGLAAQSAAPAAAGSR
jgi:hypothetical protein